MTMGPQGWQPRNTDPPNVGTSVTLDATGTVILENFLRAHVLTRPTRTHQRRERPQQCSLNTPEMPAKLTPAPCQGSSPSIRP